MSATLWPLSAAASILVVVGFLPEFQRLWAERRRGGSGVGLWIVWTVSSALGLANAVVCEASPLVVVNCATIFGLSAAAAALNCALPPPQRRVEAKAGASTPRLDALVPSEEAYGREADDVGKEPEHVS